VILFSTVTGLFPFIEKKGIVSKIAFDVINDFCKDDDCYNLLVSIFQNDPASRPSVLDILNHRWLQDEISDETTLENLPVLTSTIEPKKKLSFSRKLKKILKKNCLNL